MPRPPGPVAPGSLVCVTGANGYIASHLVRTLLVAGYRVRGTVRDPSNTTKTEHLRAIATEAGAEDRLELVAADLLEPGSFDAAVAGCDGVVHCAAAVFFAAEDPQRDLVDPSVAGTRNVLDAVAKADSVRRVVHTSSVAAVYAWDRADDHVFTEADWNTTSTLDTDPYALAKTEAEKAARAYVDGLPQADRFELVHMNPGMVWGPPLVKAHAKASPVLVRDVLSHSQPGVPQLMLSVVDVRDVAEAHLRALQHADPPKRCILVGHNGWMPDLMAQLQGLFPDVKMGTRRIPKLFVLAASLFDKTLNTQQLRHLVGRPLPMSNDLSVDAYDMQYRPLDETLKDTAAPMIANGWARVALR